MEYELRLHRDNYFDSNFDQAQGKKKNLEIKWRQILFLNILKGTFAY